MIENIFFRNVMNDIVDWIFVNDVCIYVNDTTEFMKPHEQYKCVGVINIYDDELCHREESQAGLTANGMKLYNMAEDTEMLKDHLTSKYNSFVVDDDMWTITDNELFVRVIIHN